MNKKVLSLCLLGCLFLCMISGIAGCVGCDGDSPSSKTIIEPGSLVKIEGKSNATVCSTSKENHQQLAKYARAKDRQGMEQMLLQGKIFTVEKGTTATVLQTTTLDGIEIRIQDGKHEGTECWTERSFLKRVKE